MNEIEKILDLYKIRPTANRLLMFRYLREQDAALTLNQIETGLDNADRTTLYRTIKTFEEKGIVHQVDDGTGVAKYALNELQLEQGKNQPLHLHFHCNSCNSTVCLTDHKIPNINLPAGYTAEEINLVLKGVCDKCNSQ
jgi:Fur family transcriptional regulator, ferric uptake regulator